MDQNQTPLLDAIRDFQEKDPAFFRIPAHRFQHGISSRLRDLMGEKVFRCDLTEAEGLDDLHHPEGAILQAQLLAADLYGADRSWFLVNGTTCGNEAMILTAAGPGEKIILPRNAHKSVLMGLILSGASPVWMMPEYLENWGLTGRILPEILEGAFKREPKAKAALGVSPTYYGICSNLKQMADICHAKGAMLLVDEAHGAHLYFSKLLPPGALQQGADLCAQSTHKTGGGMTQSSLLHCQGSLVDQNRLDEHLKLVMSTSPSYVLMASLDAARYELATQGKTMMERALKLATEAGNGLRKIPGIRVLESGDLPGLPGMFLNSTRLVFYGRELGLSGFRFQEELYHQAGVSTELADHENVVAVITWANSREDIERLVRGVKEIASQRWEKKPYGPLTEAKLPQPPKIALTPREAYYAPKRTVSLEEAKGKVAGEMVAPYPPGIPLIYPGEIMTDEIYLALDQCRKEKRPLRGPASPSLIQFRIIE